jgi:predicted acylesterase/phospholipase RssA
MQDKLTSKLAIASSAGGFKGVFVHGVLSALEAAGIRAGAYAATSSSVFPSISAAVGQANEIALKYWRVALHTLEQPGNGMSESVLASISASAHILCSEPFQASMPHTIIATSAVITAEGAQLTQLTQGDGARRLGRRLLLQAARGDRSWAEQHLRAYLFDTAAPDEAHRLTMNNIESVIYASTRMLHAWSIPAEVAGHPYIDGYYTCACPAIEMTQQGYREVIAIATEPGPLYRDIFRSELIPDAWEGIPIHIIRPEIDPASIGADFTNVTDEGLVAGYQHGLEIGRRFVERWTRADDS